MAKAKVQIAVDDGSGTICPGSVKRLSLRAALGVFREDTCPALEPGRRVHLILSSSSTQELLAVEATVQQINQHPPFQVVVFRFTDPQPRARQLIDPGARAERRNGERLDPGDLVENATLGVPGEIVSMLPSIPGSAIYRDDDIHVCGHLADLSVHGAAVSVEREAEIAFVASDRVVVTFDLAGEDGTMTIAGRIRHRQDDKGRLLYGIAFDWDATEDRWALQESLSRHLAELTVQPDRRASDQPVEHPHRATDEVPAENDHPTAKAPAAGLQDPPREPQPGPSAPLSG